MSQLDMVDIWGRLPVRSRSYLRHVLALPGERSGINYGVDMVLTGDAQKAPTLWVHETAHSLDYYANGSHLAQGPLSGERSYI